MRIIIALLMVGFTMVGLSQSTFLEGYIYESGNRGYISGVSVTAENMETEEIIGKTKSDATGFFQIKVPTNSKIRIYAAKDMFDIKRIETVVGTGKTFLKLEMGRSHGYTFEVTLAEKRSSPDQIVDAITGTRIEVYNNTTRQSVMDLKDHDNPEFQLNLEKGNHYTILIRKNGFLSKRMEVKVDVEDCILCFEGVGKVDPGVSDNLTEGNAFGVLLANVELERIFEGKTMEIQNLYYDLAKWNLKPSARQELNKVITLMKDNPSLTLELGSHTDSRGTSQSNLELSNKRAKAAVNYLIQKGNIAKSRFVSKGYGENELLNECADGVSCTEEAHAINRRTELKIIGITDIKQVKSLAQMKKEEYLEKEILGLMDQEQIQAKNEEELKQKIEAGNKGAKMEDPVILKEVEGAEKEIADGMQRLIDSEKKSEEVVLQNKVEEAKIVEHKDVVILREGEGVEIEDSVILSEIEGAEIGISDTSKTPEYQKPAPISDGVKIVLIQSKTPLPKDHFIFLRHKGIEMMDNGQGIFYYMIGGFEHEPAAFKFRRSFILPDKKYKGNFVASFKNGVMSVVNE